jgi:uncharacterized damage-inducible protein DinB
MTMDSTREAIRDLLVRDLQRLQRQIDLYPTEESLWRVEGEIINSAGVLATHVAGNLLHYVGAVLGGSGYVRDRPAEFEPSPRSRDELLAQLREAQAQVEAVVPAIPEDVLLDVYPDPPEPFRGRTTLWFLMHLTTHLSWHLGQVDYHRRILRS